MKRFFCYVLALIMVMSLSSPVFAAITEDPNEACGISTHLPPSGYRYVGCTTGNTQVEVTLTGIGGSLVGLIPGLGLLMVAITSGVVLSELEQFLEDDILYGRYYKYEWSNGTNSWYHIVWVSDYDNDGYDNYVTCKIQTA